MAIDWKGIRPLNGGQQKSFKELCCQLAREVTPLGAEFIRNGTPDGGVECVIILPSGDEWGWQSKYVFVADAPQWAQMDESVKTALDKRQRLVRYHICLPMDLPDGRVSNSTSAREKWRAHVAKWESWATAKSMSVEFILWDSSLLLNELAQTKNCGRVMFWFDSPGCFDDGWFKTHIDLAIKSAGPRYTPELHVEVPISQCFEAFGRTQQMVDRVQASARELRDHFRSISGWSDKEETPGLEATSHPLKQRVERLYTLLDGFSAIPSGPQGLTELCQVIKLAQSDIVGVQTHLYKVRATAQELSHDTGEAGRLRENRLKQIDQMRAELREFQGALHTAERIYAQEATYAETQRMVIVGEAGTGKTHLLCDLAKQRLQEDRPTILLLGQTFTSTEAPTTQVLALLGLPRISLDEFVGCLEACAQAFNARCLVLIDALNEGMGRQFWPAHLATFVETITSSPWLAIALSVRTCYQDSVVPTEVLATAALVRHKGFEDVQNLAAKSFFIRHDLEFASTPVFSREFSNPLFLKTLCRGLKQSGHRSLPRGFHGITKIFGLYISSMNEVLAKRLGFHPQLELVQKSLRSLALAMAIEKQRCFNLERGQQNVDRYLPGRDYGNSLYKALVDEGLLMEAPSYRDDGTRHYIVSIAYERWADHLAAKELLDAHLDPADPSAAFKPDGPMALSGGGSTMSEGLMEALSIQLPERIGRELLSLVPDGLNKWGMVDAFLNSVEWRAPSACTPAMKALMQYFERDDVYRSEEVWNTRLTVATIPGHSLNMESMDRWLRSIPMADRDAYWSISIHQLWDQDRSICNLIDWAWSVEKGTPLEDDAIWLSSLTLCWCFTSSHRFLRDRATKAAVKLLDGRLDWAEKLVWHFAKIDDLYVSERVLAVACGVALRSFDAKSVGRLAEAIYETVFASGSPPAHILLRDYARSVIERAAYLGCTLSFDPLAANPPYLSVWPTIPAEAEIEALKTDLDEIGKTKSDEEWALHSIFSSVTYGDFGRYVIGTNSSSTSWLSLRMDAPEWKSPEKRIDELVATFTRPQKARWLVLERLHKPRRFIHPDWSSVLVVDNLTTEQNETVENLEQTLIVRIMWAEEQLRQCLDDQQFEALDALLKERDKVCAENPPAFDLHLIERYVIKRVLDLGWTVQRFGWFDGTYMKDRLGDRSPSKAERMGKKYQWIAYHEISALIADHFKYHERWYGGGEDVKTYFGPWQGRFRDTDPTHTIKSLPLSRPRIRPKSAWWMPVSYNNWQREQPGAEWAHEVSDFPDIPKSLLRVTDGNGVSWLRTFGIDVWENKRPSSARYGEVERRCVWLKSRAFLVRKADAKTFLDWIMSLGVQAHWLHPELPRSFRLFLGEHEWSQAHRSCEGPYRDYAGWIKPEDCAVETLSISVEYLEEQMTFDCSMDDGFSLAMPCGEIIRDWNLRWTGIGADFADQRGCIVAQDPSAHEQGDECPLMRDDEFRRYLDARELTVVWAVCGGKECVTPGGGADNFHSMRLSGAFELRGGNIEGRLNHEFAD